jgi:hypothetical protein
MRLLLMKSTKYDTDKWYVITDNQGNGTHFTLSDKITVLMEYTRKFTLDEYFITDNCVIEKEYTRVI